MIAHERLILRMPELCRTVGLSRATIYEMINRGAFPRPVPLTERAVGWPLDEVRDWLTERKQIRDASS